jgi:hypothetical protein
VFYCLKVHTPLNFTGFFNVRRSRGLKLQKYLLFHVSPMNFPLCFMLRISELGRGWLINIYVLMENVIECQICKNRRSLPG